MRFDPAAALAQLCPEVPDASALISEHYPRAQVLWDSALGAWLLRDDRTRFATHKARALGVQIAAQLTHKIRGVAISSSGNAARAMGLWCSHLDLLGVAFLSHKTADAKVAAVAETGVTTVVTTKPKNFARYVGRLRPDWVDLRPSAHPEGRWGYRLMASELTCEVPNITDVFLFCSSGVTLLGASEGFQRLVEATTLTRVPRLHAVQCTPHCDLARALDAPERPQDAPAVGALGAQVPPDLDRVAEAIRASRGYVWMVTNQDIAAARRKHPDLDAADEVFGVLAGLAIARNAGEGGEAPALVVAAPHYAEPKNRPEVLELSTYKEVRSLIEELSS